ncbi:MAG TPA: hypothetical protein VF097_02450 [Actinomycetota bacterium]
MSWALEPAANPSILRFHVREELTKRTIETCPPATPPEMLDPVLALDDVRSVDLHRYRARINLSPGVEALGIMPSIERLLAERLGPAEYLPPDPPPQAYPVDHEEPRIVAESLEMAGDQPILRALFETEGVAEAILGTGLLLVRLGRLFTWEESGDAVQRALDSAAG